MGIYELHICFGVREENPSVCNGNGFCWEDNQCTCNGDFGYFGLDCDTRTCHGVESNDKRVCSGNGFCNIDSVCVCDAGWYGTICNITACAGVFTNETSGGEGGLQAVVCSGHGECYAPNKCLCSTDDYYGDGCEKTYCDYIPSEDVSNACSGHGTCWPKDTCVCGSSEYTGSNCEVFYCFGVKSTDYSEVCSGGGTCSETDKCDCITGEYSGEKCNYTTCFGVPSTSGSVCGGIGKCWPFDYCTCNDGSFGNCNITRCNEKDKNDVDVCNNRGNCSSTNNCTCNEPNKYWGADCEHTFCDGVKSTETLTVCWGGRAKCIDYNNCSCYSGYWGDECQYFTCNGLKHNEGGVCSDRGSCSGRDTCTCNSGYDPVSYCYYHTCYGVASNVFSGVCNGKGTCEEIDTCRCQTSNGYFGKKCEEHIPPTNNARLIFDYFAKRRLMQLSFVCPVEYLSHPVGTEFDCISGGFILSTRRNTTTRNATHSWLGHYPVCQFLGSQTSTTMVQIKIDSDAPRFRKLWRYDIEIQLQSVSQSRRTILEPFNYTYVFYPAEDEIESGTGIIVIDNNNEPEEDDEEEPGAVGVVAGTYREGESSGFFGWLGSSVAFLFSSISIVVSLVLLILAVFVIVTLLFVFLIAGCCLCCLCCCFFYFVCCCLGGGDKGDTETDQLLVGMKM